MTRYLKFAILTIFIIPSSFGYEMTVNYLNCTVKKISIMPDWVEIRYDDILKSEYLNGVAEIYIGNVKSESLNEKWEIHKKLFENTVIAKIELGKSVPCEVISDTWKDNDGRNVIMFMAKFKFNERLYLLSIMSYSQKLTKEDIIKNSLDTLWTNINR